MPRYKCPECDQLIQRETPVPAGKKLRCPECEAVFAPVELRESAPSAKAATKPAPKPEPKPEPPKQSPLTKPVDEDLEMDATPYGLRKEPEGVSEIDAKPIHFGELRDKYPKSKRGPAIAMSIEASNFLTAEGIIVSVGAIVLLFVAIFPMVFNDKPLTGAETRFRVVMMVGAALMFGWGACICIGAAKLQNLESQPWAMVGAILGILPFFFGVYALIVLYDPLVRAGFEETQTNPDYRPQRGE